MEEEHLLPPMGSAAAGSSSPRPRPPIKVKCLHDETETQYFISSQDAISPVVMSQDQSLLHRSHSAPSLFTSVTEASLGCEGDGGLAAPPYPEPSFVKLASVGLVLYLASGVTMYAGSSGSFEGRKSTSKLVDGLYFSVVTLCTIGYGDLVPRTVFAKLFTCTLILYGFGFVYALLNGLVAYALDRQEEALLGAVGGSAKPSAVLHTYVMDVKKGRVRVRTKVGLAVGVVVVCVALGTAMARVLEGMGWVDGFYLSVTSVTTVGFGDLAFATTGGRAFATVWLLVSTLAVARAFLYLTELQMEKRNRRVARWVLHRKMTLGDLVAADLDNDGSLRMTESAMEQAFN